MFEQQRPGFLPFISLSYQISNFLLSSESFQTNFGVITNQRLLSKPDVTSPAVKPQGEDFILGFCEHTAQQKQ